MGLSELGGIRMKKTSIAALAVVTLLLSTTLASIKIVRTSSVFPTSNNPTLLTSLSPLNVTLGQNVTWLIWTDPNASGHLVSLQITDVTNSTTIFEGNATLSTLNKCGSLIKQVSTAGYRKDEYQFTTKMAQDGMTMESSRYLDFRAVVAPTFSIYCHASPHRSIPGENVTLTVSEGIYPYINALANITLYNTTKPSIWTLNNVMIASANGSRVILIPTRGLDAGFYEVNVTASSAKGIGSSTTGFQLSDVIVAVSGYFYLIGDHVNVSVRTYASISHARLRIYQFGFLPSLPVVDESMTLTNGKASKLYDSSSWSEGNYVVTANVTVGARVGIDITYFALAAFLVSVNTDKYHYAAGELVNITTSTIPSQANALFNLTITNSTYAIVWTHGPAHLNSSGVASVQFNTSGLPPDDYSIKVVVNTTHYEETGYASFVIPLRTFDIYATVEPYMNTGYVMPNLNTTVVAEQTDANITIEVSSGANSYYTFTKNSFNISTYDYLIPAVDLPNGTYSVDVSVASAIGTNSTSDSFHYSNGKDSDGDGLPDSQEGTIGTNPYNPDTDRDGFFDGIEVFHGSNPLDPHSVIPEQILMQLIALVCTTPLIYLVARRKSKLLES